MKPRSLVVAIDVGNTNITFAIFEEDQVLHSFRFLTKKLMTSDQYGMEIANFFQFFAVSVEEIKDVILCSVVPSLNIPLAEAIKKYLHKEVLYLRDLPYRFTLSIDEPSSLGDDRLATSYAAHKLFGGDLLVIDFGTATTFDLISQAGAFLGGSIAPGLLMVSHSLISNTAKLEEFGLRFSERLIATNTETALQSGVVNGYWGMCQYLIKGIQAEYPHPLQIVVTGGMANLMMEKMDGRYHHDPLLTMKGILLLYQDSRS